MSVVPSRSTMMTELRTHLTATQKAITSIAVANDEMTVTVERDGIVKFLEFLVEDSQCRFETLVDLCGADYPTERERFEVVYHLLSMRLNQRIRVKLRTDEATPVPSVTGVFPVANWYERETFDMYGVIFSGHPDLRRILTDYGFDGYPLRKDFPLSGRVQVRYDEAQKRVINEPVKLVQEYRNFDFLSPWEGMQAVIPGDEKAGEAKK
jgi:NADH-quinone oxidoreductase subunit C